MKNKAHKAEIISLKVFNKIKIKKLAIYFKIKAQKKTSFGDEFYN